MTRTLLNESENSEIDKEIKELLLYLSEYFAFEGTHLVIEYLLRNYRIHEYLPNEVVISFIQYHSTSIYTRLLQNVVKT